MQMIKVDLKNCYGIRELTHKFDTAEGNAFIIYAPNGTMKTSLARVFSDVAKGLTPRDTIFPNRKTEFSITDESDTLVPPDRILVVEPYSEGYSSEKTSTLMADVELRRQYATLVSSIDSKAKIAVTALGKAAGLRSGVDGEISKAFGLETDNLYTLLDRIYSLVEEGKDPGIGHIAYSQIFNTHVMAFLEKESIRQQLADYVNRYEYLVDNSAFFRRGVFNHNHAANVGKSLGDNGFFTAQHSVTLTSRDEQKLQITSTKDLGAALERETQVIFSDAELRSKFDAIDKEITKNADLRNFREFLEKNPEILPELSDLTTLREKLWLSYCFAAEVQVSDFGVTYRAARSEIARLVELAKKQETEWKKALSIFHRRFSVPFSLEVINQDDVILKDQAPSLLFRYKDGEDSSEIGRSELVQALSTGERRALYLLNVLFEIEARTKEPDQTILVLDDIADSFDYKNKYAIIEYIKAIIETGKFMTFILTHNFDFYRTVRSRLSVGRKQNSLMAIKNGTVIALTQAQNLDPFPFWRKNLHRNRRLLLASIPMVRNLVEYQKGEAAPEFMFLTSILHLKPGSKTITMTQLADRINTNLGTTAPGGPEFVFDVIMTEAEACVTDDFTINLENKVVLSIAIRLLAEDLMITKINDPVQTDNIGSNQTRQLFEIYRGQFPGDLVRLELFDRVMLMTPEAIHLNSFMYEPILDMADDHLKSLYQELKAMPK